MLKLHFNLVNKFQNNRIWQQGFEPLLLPIPYCFRATTMNKSCSPIDTLQVFYCDLLPKAHGLHDIEFQSQLIIITFRIPKVNPIWTFAITSNFSMQHGNLQIRKLFNFPTSTTLVYRLLANSQWILNSTFGTSLEFQMWLSPNHLSTLIHHSTTKCKVTP
jgi:hypothetical protein